ncbi:MAG: UDP-2,3-diacylglucosamine diphosphatase LpxI [Hyphomicrobium sp.]
MKAQGTTVSKAVSKPGTRAGSKSQWKSASPLHLGIIAGGGSLPAEIARSVTGRGGSVHIAMIEGEADDALRTFPHTVLNWAELGRAVRVFKRAGVKDMIMVGRMSRPSFKTAKPDFGFLFSLPKIIKALRAGGDDAVLRGVVRLFEARRFRVLSVADVAPELLIAEGPLGFHRPIGADEADVARGMSLISALGRYDIGQAVVVSNGKIEGIEGAEGTDRMVRRIGDLRTAAGIDVASLRSGVLVKRPKPGQDTRLDLPAIGPETVEGAVQSGLSGIAGLTGEVLAANRYEMVDRADRAQIFITGVGAADPGAPASPEPAPRIEPIVFGRLAIPPERVSDVENGVRIMGALADFATGSALVIAGGRVVAVGAGESSADVIQRARSYFNRKRRNAVLIVGASEALDEALIRAAAAAGLAGVIVMFGPGDGPRHKGPVLDVADRFQMFIAGAAADPRVAAF